MCFSNFLVQVIPATRSSNFATLHDNTIKKREEEKVNRLG